MNKIIIGGLMVGAGYLTGAVVTTIAKSISLTRSASEEFGRQLKEELEKQSNSDND